MKNDRCAQLEEGDIGGLPTTRLLSAVVTVALLHRRRKGIRIVADIEDLVNNCDFVEVAYLLIKGELPNYEERRRYAELLNRESMLHYDMQSFFRRYPQDSHPMSILAAMSVSLSAFYPEMDDIDPEAQIDFAVTRLLSKIRTITAFTYRQMLGEEFVPLF